MSKIEQQKTKLEETKRKLKQKESKLRVMEKMQNQNTLSSLGSLFIQTQTSHLDRHALIGALLEIAEKSKNEKSLSAWREKSEHFERDQKIASEKKKGSQLVVRFNISPPSEIKEKLKELKFKWNGFRGEYYGLGNKSVLDDLLKGYEYSIEMIQNQ